MVSAHQKALEQSMLGYEPLLPARSKCVGLWGAIFGHNWLTCSQVEPVPEENRLRVYTARRCRRCYAEDADFGRVYSKPQTVAPGGLVMLGEHPPFALRPILSSTERGLELGGDHHEQRVSDAAAKTEK